MMTFKPAAALALALLGAGSASAATDPLGDFLGTYTGSLSANLDFVSADARFTGTHFNLSLKTAGAIGGLPGSLYVIGINRGAGTPRLNVLSDPDLDPSVRWDSLAVLLPDGTLRVVTFPPAGAPTITPIFGGAVVNGDTISASVPVALLPTRGFAASSYTFQAWSRLRVNPAADGLNSEIADFGPRIFAAVPEPASWAMMIAGFGLAGWSARRRTPRLPPARA
ncbi:PEPxxWA-CTERM sorting domain-containing protein [Sphingomonas sp.]|jgi:hypothetical protein|uniref:PEPxxWA-CTERM sorting domain-containing protein n=1 Tax=Sphingomonas sp. TaxID=28214 RepID=UPI002DF43DCD|nr:PEPxxWA-CTERM sorting domain-containing protein [Sphingomonas sp.]